MVAARSATGRGAPLSTLDDVTSLDDERVDVGPRIGWLLRTARLSAPLRPVTTQSAMRAALADFGYRVSAGVLSQVEAGKLRSGRIISGYEKVLGFPDGQLASAISILCRTFPYGPPDKDPTIVSPEVSSVSALSAAVAVPCTGGTWLDWSRAISTPNAVGMPEWIAQPWVDRLASELGRSVGSAYLTRYEAITQLRAGPYGHLVYRAARRAVEDPDVQVLFDLMSSVSDVVDMDAFDWFVDLLTDDRPNVVRGAMLAITNMVVVGCLTDEFLATYEDRFAAAYEVSTQSRESEEAVSALLLALPPANRGRLAARIGRAVPAPPRWRRLGPKAASNPQWSIATRVADNISRRLGLIDTPMLTRLIFEFVYEHRMTRSTTSMFLFMATPFVREVAEALWHEAHLLTDQDRDFVLERLVEMQSGTSLPPVLGWPRLGRVEDTLLAVTLAGQAGQPIDPSQLDHLLERGGFCRRRALYAAGMSNSPWLQTLVDNPAVSRDVRGAARWWLTEGGAVRDPDARNTNQNEVLT